MEFWASRSSYFLWTYFLLFLQIAQGKEYHLETYRNRLTVSRGVHVTEIRLLSGSNKTQYVLQGETFTLTCLYILGENEKLQRVRWFKDDMEVYVWRKDRLPLARNLFEKQVEFASNQPPSYITIRKAHMSMQGNYTCIVETDEGKSQNDFFLTVIVDACKEDSWQTFSDRVKCTEDVILECSGMFPKPSPACGIYNDRTGVFLNTVPFDRVDQTNTTTYNVKLHGSFRADDWLTYKDISFRCHVIVLGTDWRSGITTKLFGDAGCPSVPPEITNGYYNISGKETCWRTPSEGSRVEYNCFEGLQMIGPRSFVCKNRTWLPTDPEYGDDITVKQILCERNDANSKRPWTTVILLTLPLLGFLLRSS